MHKKALIGGLLSAALLGVAVVLIVRARSVSDGPPLDPRIALWEPALQPRQAAGKFEVSWNDGVSPPYAFLRKVRGWERIDGLPALRVELVAPTRRGRERVFVTEWLRPRADGAEAELLCVRRKIGLTVVPLDPPQPVLRTPLEPGKSWTWRGRAGPFETEATFRVLPAPEPGLLVVEQKTVVRGPGETVESLQTHTYKAEVGMTAENGTFPVKEPLRAYDRQRGKRVKPKAKTAKTAP